MNAREITLTSDSFYVDEEELRSYLKTVPQLIEENMKKPVDSKLIQGEGGFIEVTSSADGNEIDFEEAFKLAKRCLQNGEMVIDFTAITNVEPKVKSNDPKLVEIMQKVNTVLKSEITFVLTDKSTYTLDVNTMRYWVYEDAPGSFDIKIEENLEAFVDTLEEKVKVAGAELEVETVNFGKIILPVDWENRTSVNKEAEIAQITEEIQAGKILTRDPIYSRLTLLNELSSYIEIDLENQRVYMYVDGEQIVDEPCVTGTANTKRATPPGVYYLLLKQTDKDFKTYGGHSDYWMQFTYDGIGLHDATWRPESDFVPTTYLTRGSHGCVNLQWDTAKKIYNNITYKMPIIVH